MTNQGTPEAASEATTAASVYPRGVINPLAIVRRAGPLVALSDLESGRKKKRKRVNRVDTSLRKALSYPDSAIRLSSHGMASTSSIYPYISGSVLTWKPYYFSPA